MGHHTTNIKEVLMKTTSPLSSFEHACLHRLRAAARTTAVQSRRRSLKSVPLPCPDAEILEIVKPELEKDGIKLEIVESQRLCTQTLRRTTRRSTQTSSSMSRISRTSSRASRAEARERPRCPRRADGHLLTQDQEHQRGQGTVRRPPSRATRQTADALCSSSSVQAF